MVCHVYKNTFWLNNYVNFYCQKLKYEIQGIKIIQLTFLTYCRVHFQGNKRLIKHLTNAANDRYFLENGCCYASGTSAE